MTCQCGLQLMHNRAHPEIRECVHCDRNCMAGECLHCRRIGLADGIGPKTRPGR